MGNHFDCTITEIRKRLYRILEENEDATNAAIIENCADDLAAYDPNKNDPEYWPQIKIKLIPKPIENGDARGILERVAKTLTDRPVPACYGTLKMLFRDAATYGFNFEYVTSDGNKHSKLPEYDETYKYIVVGWSFYAN